MGKKKKVTEKVKLFYRGPLREPTKVANEAEMQTIVEALLEYYTSKGDKKTLLAIIDNRKVFFKIHLGLKSSLRCLRQKKASALVYDDTASPHLSKYFNEFGYKYTIPVIKAHRLIDHAPKIKLQTLLAFTIEELVIDKQYANDGGDLESTAHSSKIINNFWLLLVSHIYENQPREIFKPPVLDKVPVTGKSNAKKETKRALKQAKMETT